MYVLSYLLSFCKCPDKSKDPFDFEYDPDTVEVLRQIYNETNKKLEFETTSDEETDEETDSEDSDYSPDESVSDSETSEDELEPEELQVKKDINSGFLWLF
jgi:hypothetical protein